MDKKLQFNLCHDIQKQGLPTSQRKSSLQAAGLSIWPS